MDKGAWQATVHGVARLGHDRVTNFQFITQKNVYVQRKDKFWFIYYFFINTFIVNGMKMD